ncbi:MAG TPA: hypothetical protein VFN68_07175, partial [Acidimicrobiales bacterium]|nr:hypothetical protein [Acidimicrobiales bacterium]
AIESDLEGLTRGDDPLVARLARRPGQKEERWTQLIADTGAGNGPGAVPVRGDGGTGGSEAATDAWTSTAPSGVATAAATAAPMSARPPDEDLRKLREQIASLRADVEMLRDEVLSLRLELAEALEAR